MALALLILVALLLSYANGANDNFKPVATIYGSSTLGYRASLWWATGAQVGGSIVSVFVAGALLQAFGGKGLIVADAMVDEPEFLLSVGLGAALTVLLATRLGMPVSTTHALIGGLLGAGLWFSPAELIWSGLGRLFVAPLLVSPLLAAGLAALLYPIARSGRRRLGIDGVTCVCVGDRVEPVSVTGDGTLVMARTGLELTADQLEQCQKRYHGSMMGVSAERIVNTLHLTSAVSLGFARGLNDTPKIMALLVAATWSGLAPGVTLAAIALVMALGGLVHSRRIATTLGKRVTEMNCGQGFIANFVASVLVIGASSIGAPVSTTHVSAGAIFGIGIWTGKTHWDVVGQILGSWVATLPLALVLAYGVGAVVG